MSAFSSLGRLDDFMTRNRRNVIRGRRGGGCGVAGADGIRAIRFQSAGSAQPQGGIGFHLAGPDEESADLAQHHRCARLSLAEADAIAQRIQQEIAGGAGPHLCPALCRTSRRRKLALIADASNLLDATLNPFDVMPPPSDADQVAAFKSTAGNCAPPPEPAPEQPAQDARRLADALDAVVKAAPRAIAQAPRSFEPGLKTMLGQVSDSPKAAPVTVDNMPADLRADWVAAGRHRPHPGLSQGHQQRSQSPVGLFRIRC